jgi:hypothetical protein
MRRPRRRIRLSSVARHGATKHSASTGRVDNIVKYCVEFVHAFPAHNQMDVTTNEGFFNKFDAFYNPATGTVQSNATEVVGDLEPLYEFNKCMAGEGFPLK